MSNPISKLMTVVEKDDAFGKSLFAFVLLVGFVVGVFAAVAITIGWAFSVNVVLGLAVIVGLICGMYKWATR